MRDENIVRRDTYLECRITPSQCAQVPAEQKYIRIKNKQTKRKLKEKIKKKGKRENKLQKKEIHKRKKTKKKNMRECAHKHTVKRS